MNSISLIWIKYGYKKESKRSLFFLLQFFLLQLDSFFRSYASLYKKKEKGG